MRFVLIFSMLFLGNLAFANELDCEFSAPNFHEWVKVPVKPEMWTFVKTASDFTYSIDIDNDSIIGISIKDTMKNVTTQTIATTGAGIFAKPRQLSLNSDGRYAEVNCW